MKGWKIFKKEKASDWTPTLAGPSAISNFETNTVDLRQSTVAREALELEPTIVICQVEQEQPRRQHWANGRLQRTRRLKVNQLLLKLLPWQCWVSLPPFRTRGSQIIILFGLRRVAWRGHCIFKTQHDSIDRSSFHFLSVKSSPTAQDAPFS